MIKMLKFCLIALFFVVSACAPERPMPTSPDLRDGNNHPGSRLNRTAAKPAEDPVANTNNNDIEAVVREFLKGQNPPVSGNPTAADIFRIYKPKDIKKTFADIVGLEDAKASLENIISYLRDPVNFRRLGAKPPKGIIFYGPPGTGKTALARAFAGEVGKARQVTFIVASGASFENKYVGVGADNVRKLFALARKHKPAIIFIDEFDAVAGKRSEESKNIQMVNQLLTELDGFDGQESADIFLIAATNLLKNIDEAVKRAGRIDRKIEIPLPHPNARKEIIEHYLALEPKITGIDLPWLVAQTDGFNAADLEVLVNEARIHATQRNADRVETKDFDQAVINIKKSHLPE